MWFMTSGKALAIGSAFFTTGAGISVSFGVMNVQAKEQFWSLPVLVGAALALLGLVFVVLGAFIRDTGGSSPKNTLKQYGGNGSRNFQAGGDLSIGDHDKA